MISAWVTAPRPPLPPPQIPLSVSGKGHDTDFVLRRKQIYAKLIDGIYW